MIWLTWKLLTLPFRIVFGTLGLTVRTIRFVGVSRIVAFGAGVATGMAVAPVPGRELRAQVLPAAGAGGTAAPGDLAAVVAAELASGPRTWHLPQPAVTVADGRVTLTGPVPHDEARLALVRAAGAIAGVRAVEDHLSVEG